MYINERIRKKRKLVEKLGSIPSKLPVYLLLTIVDYKTSYQIKVDPLRVTKIIKYTNNLILIFMTINENIRNKNSININGLIDIT